MQPGAWKHESIRESTYTGNFRWYAGRLQHLVCIIPSWRYNAFPSGLEELAPSHFMNIIQVQKGQQRCFSELNYCYSDNLISNLAHTLLSQTVPLWYRDALYPQLPNAIPWKVKSKKKKKEEEKRKKKKTAFGNVPHSCCLLQHFLLLQKLKNQILWSFIFLHVFYKHLFLLLFP